MTIKELSQMKALNIEIAEMKKRLSELKSLGEEEESDFLEICGVAQKELTNEAQMEIAELTGLIQFKLLKCLKLLKEIERFIDAIDDSRIRLIFSLRYVNGLSWQQIAFSIGDYDEQYPRRLHNSYIKNHNLR